MNDIVKINDTELKVIKYHGQRVVTLAHIDEVHKRNKGTARKRFNDNRQRLIEGEDFFELDQASEIRTLGFERPQGGTPEKLVLVTESGYLMLVKSLKDDLAWQVQRRLVNAYFRGRESERVEYSVGATDALTLAEADQLRDMLHDAAQQLPKDARGRFLTTGWSKLKAHFGVTYRDIPRTEFNEALSIVARHVASAETATALPTRIQDQNLSMAPGGIASLTESVASLVSTVATLTKTGPKQVLVRRRRRSEAA